MINLQDKMHDDRKQKEKEDIKKREAGIPTTFKLELPGPVGMVRSPFYAGEQGAGGEGQPFSVYGFPKPSTREDQLASALYQNQAKLAKVRSRDAGMNAHAHACMWHVAHVRSPGRPSSARLA